MREHSSGRGPRQTQELEVVQCSGEIADMPLRCWGCRMISSEKFLLDFPLLQVQSNSNISRALYPLTAGTIGTSVQTSPPDEGVQGKLRGKVQANSTSTPGGTQMILLGHSQLPPK